MDCATTLLVVSTLLCGQLISGQTRSRCGTLLRTGSTCVRKGDPCPSGTTEYLPYSNYIGCLDLDQKCCQKDAQIPRFISEDRKTCGLGSFEPTSRILDGAPTAQCDWPFVVSIRAQLLGSSNLDYAGTSHLCQGVLVDTDWVLTSPYCVLNAANTVAEVPNKILVVAGEFNTTGIDINPNTGLQQEQMINVESAFIYPRYSFQSRDQILPTPDARKEINSDGVALLKLKEPINGPCAGIACLPLADEAANQCAAYDDCVVTGWGFVSADFDEASIPNTLRLGQVRLTSSEACDFLTERLSLTDIRPRGSMCQAGRNANTDGCPGDEGGAVLCSNGKNWVVRGILAANECQVNRFNLFVTDVSPYLGWITSTMLAQ